MQITPVQTSFPPNGPPPGFKIETGGAPYFSVQVATDAALLNGALAARRSPNNFFDSRYGDTLFMPSSGHPAPREVTGQALEAPTGRASYILPAAVWSRMKNSPKLYYRMFTYSDSHWSGAKGSLADANWRSAGAVMIGKLPVQPTRSPASAFHGESVLSKPDFLAQAIRQIELTPQRRIEGRDGDFRFVILDARRYLMTVIECYQWGLTDTIATMPRKPDVAINGQFLSGAVGIDTEGQVIREGVLIHPDSRTQRYSIAQLWRGQDVSDFHISLGDPKTTQPNTRAAFGGLGPVLISGAPVTPLTDWAQSVYDMDIKKGKGVIAIEREHGLIMLLVQQDNWLFSNNPMTLTNLRDWLRSIGFDDVVFNDGSDSEALFAGGSWLLSPGWVKDEVMDFAIGFVDKQANRRFNVLAIDGTRTKDAEAFVKKTAQPLITHFSPRNISSDLKSLRELAPLTATFNNGIIEAWQAETQAKADLIGNIFEQAGAGGNWADFMYLSSHAWRHGQLWYYQLDPVDEQQHFRAPKLMIANPWSSGFRPVWRNTPRWLVIAGCAVLALRYSRGVTLDSIERGHLVDWHQDMHGAGKAVPGLTPAKKTMLAVYHPGWAWYEKAFSRSPGLRGVLGYWYRSPSGGRDVEIVESFADQLSQGVPVLDAWEAANRGGILDADALWAAMVRDGCETDTLAVLENTTLAAAKGNFKYYDSNQRGSLVPTAYAYANRLSETSTVGGVTIRTHPKYDALAVGELNGLANSPTPENFLSYSDEVGP
jgi:hypothetical protein